jgi:signal transduction histidine kinase
VDISRVAHPLNAILRVAFAVVIIVALTVDLWFLGNSVSRLTATCVVVVAVCGVGWVAWQRSTWVVAIVASSMSLLITADAVYQGSRFTAFTEFMVLPVLFGAALWSAAPWRWPIALFVAASAETISLRADAGPVRWALAVSMLVLLGSAVTAVVYMRLRDHERQTSVEFARQNERLELARELHDVVGHHVTGIVVLAQANLFTATSNGDRELASHAQALAEIEAAGLATLTSVRRLVGLLRAEPCLSAEATFADVEQLVDELRRTHPQTEFIVDPSTRTDWVQPDLAGTVLRLVQEATTNVRKHGDPSMPVRFELRRTATSIVLCIENSPINGHASSGYGLIGMRERVEALGGTFSAGPDNPGHWAVRATVPIIDIDKP